MLCQTSTVTILKYFVQGLTLGLILGLVVSSMKRNVFSPKCKLILRMNQSCKITCTHHETTNCFVITLKQNKRTTADKTSTEFYGASILHLCHMNQTLQQTHFYHHLHPNKTIQINSYIFYWYHSNCKVTIIIWQSMLWMMIVSFFWNQFQKKHSRA